VRQGWLAWGAPLAGLIAGVIPAIYKALDFDVSLEAVTGAANSFKVLQDRFRQAASITAASEEPELAKEFRKLMDRLDSVRAASPVAPERFFKRAQEKVKKGHYAFTVDGAATDPQTRYSADARRQQAAPV
jgi:cyclopropane fatty-acyl-phospholipid synthase-like methyltransferase